MENNTGELDALIQEKLDADTDFQASLDGLDDESREQSIQAKRSEILTQEFKALKEKADKAAKAEELAENYKIRAEKAEKGSKKGDPSNGDKTPKKDGELSSRDTIVLINAGIKEEEDIDEVVNYAKFKQIPIAEALKSSVVKAALAEKAEFRATAAATNTGAGRRGSYQKSDDALISEFKSGNAPETEEEMNRLAMARMKAKAGK